MERMQDPLLINLTEARRLVGMRDSTFYLLRKDPRFPKPKYIGGKKRPMYIRKELEEWVSKLP
jgi:predicted DNA-binding transcriptional regulator AlpA